MKQKIVTVILSIILGTSIVGFSNTEVKAYTVADSSGVNLNVKSFINRDEEKIGSGDCTAIVVGNNKVVIDAGTKKKGSKSSILNLVNDSRFTTCTSYKQVSNGKYRRDKTLVIDHLIITHTHFDHINGLTNLEDWVGKNKYVTEKNGNIYYENRKVIINNLYYNGVYIGYKNDDDLDPGIAYCIIYNFIIDSCVQVKHINVYPALNANNSFDKSTKTLFNDIKKDAKNTPTLKYMASSINYISLSGTNVVLQIVPALKKYTGDSAAYNVNDSSLTAILYDKNLAFKFIFPGDIGWKTMQDINDNETIKAAFSGNTKDGKRFNQVYIKAPHHGKASGFYDHQTGESRVKIVQTFFNDIVKPNDEKAVVYGVGTIWIAEGNKNSENYTKATWGKNYYSMYLKNVWKWNEFK